MDVTSFRVFSTLDFHSGLIWLTSVGALTLIDDADCTVQLYSALDNKYLVYTTRA